MPSWSRSIFFLKTICDTGICVLICSLPSMSNILKIQLLKADKSFFILISPSVGFGKTFAFEIDSLWSFYLENFRIKSVSFTFQ